MQRVWGGRALQNQYARQLPDSAPYGESWEICDRPDAQSIIAEGQFAGQSLHQLWTNYRDEIFGPGLPDTLRFPLLIKVLDARDKLSIQVHPPADLADLLGGEPKSEMWYIADADTGAKLYIGLKNGVSRSDFEAAIEHGNLSDLVHSITPDSGESIYIPSGRLHAIGAGFLIHEIQQNSDTTYRVFDWNRVGLDGKERDLHIEESLKSIDFNDFEPSMDQPIGPVIAECQYFRVEKLALEAGSSFGNPSKRRFSIFSIAEGSASSDQGRDFKKGDFFLLPRNGSPLTTRERSIILRTSIP